MYEHLLKNCSSIRECRNTYGSSLLPPVFELNFSSHSFARFQWFAKSSGCSKCTLTGGFLFTYSVIGRYSISKALNSARTPGMGVPARTLPPVSLSDVTCVIKCTRPLLYYLQVPKNCMGSGETKDDATLHCSGDRWQMTTQANTEHDTCVLLSW